MRGCEKERDLVQIRNSMAGRAITDSVYLKKYGDDHVLLPKMLEILENHPSTINKSIINISNDLSKLKIEKSKYQARYDVAIKYNFTLDEPVIYSTLEKIETQRERTSSINIIPIKRKSFWSKLCGCFRRNARISPM